MPVGAVAIIVAAMDMTFGWRLLRRKIPASPS
jgi:hypothetical protein